jgi:bifunctional DNase/RNase
MRELAHWLGSGPLLRVRSTTCRVREKRPTSWLMLELKQGRAAAVRVKTMEALRIQTAVRGEQLPRPMTHNTFCNLLDQAGVVIDAVVLLRRTRSGIEAVLVARKGEQQEPIRIAGPAAFTVARAAKCPILITESLAEKLCVRGKSGKPLSLRSAQKKLLGK